jgi:hypothetical protein
MSDQKQPVEGDYLAPGETVSEPTERLDPLHGRQCRKCRWRFGPTSAFRGRCVQCKGPLEAAVDIPDVPFTQWETRRLLPPYARINDEITYVGYNAHDFNEDGPKTVVIDSLTSLSKALLDWDHSQYAQKTPVERLALPTEE